MKTEKQMAVAAAEFAERWKGRGYERGESQPFWIDKTIEWWMPLISLMVASFLHVC